VLVEWNATAAEYPRDACLHRLFEARAAQAPEAIALASEDRRLTYGSLNARANRLAHRLRGMGIGPDDLVGLCVERSPEMAVGIARDPQGRRGLRAAGPVVSPRAPGPDARRQPGPRPRDRARPAVGAPGE
jgi:non-ribosomal peptide synthetase component F